MPRYSLGGGGGDAAITAINNAAENLIVTVGSTTTELEAESTLTFASNKMIPTASAHNAVGTALTVSAGATTAGTTNNIAGGALTVQGGQGKGSGAGGDIIFQTANAGGSGSTINALATALTLSDDLSATFAGAVDLGSNTLTSTGSLQVRTIDYSDGDLAITIADGGGITSAAGITSTAAANAFGASSFAGDVAVADSKFIEFESAAGTPTTDNTVQGVVIEFLAVEAITQFDAVYVSTTTGRVGRADANDAAKMPVIGIAIEAQGSAGSSVRVLTHGVYRDDGGFGGNMTVGVDLYAPETPGTLTTTRPSDDGDFIQVIGVAIGVRSAFINPSLDVIEHA
jgi:hypothetical protein